eukprot:5076592-Amphidinium_carterae.1
MKILVAQPTTRLAVWMIGWKRKDLRTTEFAWVTGKVQVWRTRLGRLVRTTGKQSKEIQCSGILSSAGRLVRTTGKQSKEIQSNGILSSASIFGPRGRRLAALQFFPVCSCLGLAPRISGSGGRRLDHQAAGKIPALLV